MCGIAGAFGAVDDTAVELTRRMSAAQAHRGPDQYGTWRSAGARGVVLGHRRLSIIDLSEAGRQPMLDEETGVAVVFNGECYNYAELRAELEAAGRRFQSATDTEVIIAAYVRWGTRALERLRGMFALAIWDPRDETLLLVRDRIGIKPLYYSEQNGRLLFASELRALLATDAVPRKLDPQSLESYLWHGFVPGPRTIVEGIRLLPAGTLLEVGMRMPPVERPYCEPRGPAVPPTVGDATGLAKAELENTVRMHLVSDVPLGIFLSGGVDSSVVAAVAQRYSSRPVATFNVRFDEAAYDESPYARRIAERLGTDHRELELTERIFTEQLENALGCIDQPTFDALNTYFVSRAVKEAGLTVALAGTGGDELFGGYASFGDLPRARRLAVVGGRLPRRVQRAFGRAAARLAMGTASEVEPQTRWGKLGDVLSTRGDLVALYQVFYSLFTRDFIEELLVAPPAPLRDGLDASVVARLAKLAGSADNQLEAISRLELASFIGERLLRDTDSASMAVSLEVRVPFLDHVLIDAIARVAPQQRFLPLRKKALLKRMVQEQLDAQLFEREKAGFQLPLAVWCRKRLAPRLDDTFSDLNLAHAIGLNTETIGRLWRAFKKGGSGVYWSRVWSLFILLTWCRTHRVYA